MPEFMDDDFLYNLKDDVSSILNVVEDLKLINYLVDKLITTILGAERFPDHHSIPGSIPDALVIDFLTKYPLSVVNAREFLVDFILRDSIFNSLHSSFFDGNYFFGVGSETLHSLLEEMILIMIANEDYDEDMIQRWRAMTVEAVFKDNDEVITHFNALLTTSINKIENILSAAFPTSAGYIIGHDEHLLLLDIFFKTRDLSFKLQHDFHSRLVVTTARTPEAADNVVGTYALGMNMISDTSRKVFLLPRAITNEQLLSFFDL